MADAKSWAERIAAWRASGLTAKQFAEGKTFSAQQIWNWSWQLGKHGLRRRRRRSRPWTTAETKSKADGKGLHLARVVTVRAATQSTPDLVVAVRGMRISVPIGFDRHTFSAVLDEIEHRSPRSEQA